MTFRERVTRPGCIGLLLYAILVVVGFVVTSFYSYVCNPLCGAFLGFGIMGFFILVAALYVPFIAKTYSRAVITALVILTVFTCLALYTHQRNDEYRFERDKNGATQGDIGAYNSALALYRADVSTKQFPTTLMQLISDDAVGWAGPYMATIGKDPWGHHYVYTGGADNYTILSIHDSRFDQGETIRYILGNGQVESIP